MDDEEGCRYNGLLHDGRKRMHLHLQQKRCSLVSSMRSTPVRPWADAAGGGGLLRRGSDLVVTDLRSIAVQGLVEHDHLPPIAEAKAVHWHARHRFCSNCGAMTDPSMAAGSAIPARPARPSIFRAPIRCDHAGERRRALPARPSPRFVPTCGRASPASSSRAKRSRMRCGAKRARKPASPVAGSLFRFAALAVPDVADDRLPRRGADARHHRRPRRSSKTRAGSTATRSSMLMRQHPEGLTTPPPVAIAHHIIRAWVEGEMRL